MSRKQIFKSLVSYILISMLVLGGFTSQVSAAMISTQDALSLDARNAKISAIQSRLAAENVRNAMIDMGVDPNDAMTRVASLNDTELMQLEQQIDELPAGGSALALIGAVFVVLLILELTGVIDIFKRT